MKNINKNNILIGLVAVLVIVLVFVLFGDKLKAKVGNGQGNGGEYSVVYATTGEIYVGQLSKYPNFRLTNVYLYQIVKDPTDPNKSNFQLQPLKEALWAPDYINFEKANIIFYGPLSAESEIAKKLAEQTN